MKRRFWVAAVVLVSVLGAVGCDHSGYVHAEDLENDGRGPTGCAKSCNDLGMRMAAMVLVSNQLPGCVCQPVVVYGAPRSSAGPVVAPPPSPGAANDLDNSGAAAAVAGEVVIAAAAAAARQQQMQQQQSYNAAH